MRHSPTIDECIQRFALDLSGLVVFTEAATGAFAVTAAIALRANAKKVYAIVRDSRYGTSEMATREVRDIISYTESIQRVVFVTDHACVGEADIITNLGFVRPFTAALIDRMKSTAVIPLMWETWELRTTEFDLKACFNRKILVLGTNEEDHRLDYIGYVGTLALKLLFDAGVAVRNSKVILCGSGKFAKAILHTLSACGCNISFVCPEELKPVGADGEWLGASLEADNITNELVLADALIFADHHACGMLMSDFINLAKKNPNISIVHISGVINRESLEKSGLTVVPSNIAISPRTMSVTPAYLGIRPIIELHAAGLKVGEEMARARLKYPDNINDAKQMALRNSLCQDFSNEQYDRYF